MVKHLFIVKIILFLTALPVTAEIINIPDDYATIQQGINAASFGDTVLVQPGAYLENINFNGRRITVASLYLTTYDEEYISATVIDGDSSGSVVTFDNFEDYNSRIIGFSIKNGFAYEGGGIRCYNSSPMICHNFITENRTPIIDEGYGGGVFCYFADPYISENTIYDNESFCGGGIYCYDSDPIIEHNYISNNYGDI